VFGVGGFTNRNLRARVATLLGEPYSQTQMSYDLRRLRLKGMIQRLPHRNTYVLTPDGQRIAVFYTKLHYRLLRPLLGDALNDHPPHRRCGGRCGSSNSTSRTTSLRRV
jgi:hypothetical protein